MRVEVKLHGAEPVWLHEGSRWTLGEVVNNKKDRRWLQGLEIEDPGWPTGTPIRVIAMKNGSVILEPDVDSEVWRQVDNTPGLKGALARWALKHVARMEKGTSDMVGELYEGCIVTTTTVAKGQHSDIERLSGYPLFSLEPLKWRNKDGFPRLAVFTLDSPTTEFAVVAGREGYYTRKLKWRQERPPLPKAMLACYADVMALLAERAKTKKKSVRLSAEFMSFIPSDVKARIAEARPNFKQLFVIAEVPKWTVTERNAPKPRPRPTADPLVVGFDGVSFWLVAAFDATPLERYIEDEWCVEPLR